MRERESTPRTDAEIAECDESLPFTLSAKDRGASLYGQVCRASFARQLERELAASRANADDWMQRYGATQGHGAQSASTPVALLERLHDDLVLRAPLNEDGAVDLSGGLWSDLCAFLASHR